jgi:hypothetical protein
VIDASEGYARANGHGTPDEEFMSHDELEELMRKFPDKPKGDQ